MSADEFAASSAMWTAVLGVGVIAVIVIGLIVGADVVYRRDELPTADRNRPTRAPDHRPAQQWQTIWIHSAPLRHFTTEQAHKVMQIHIDCSLDSCPRKRAAHATLVAAGHIRPRQRARR